MTLTNIRITGPHDASYRLGDPMQIHEGNVLLATLDPVFVMNYGTRIHIEPFTASPALQGERRHIGRLIFFEICAFISEHFPQVQAVSFAFVRPIESPGGPARQAGSRAAVLERVGVEDVRITPVTAGAHVVSGTWVYNEKNLEVLQIALAEQRKIFGADPIAGGARETAGVTAAIRRLMARRRPKA